MRTMQLFWQRRIGTTRSLWGWRSAGTDSRTRTADDREVSAVACGFVTTAMTTQEQRVGGREPLTRCAF